MNGTKLSGLWKNTSKDGKTFLSGSIGMARLLVFSNEYKKGDKDPDYYLFLAPREKREEKEPKVQDLF